MKPSMLITGGSGLLGTRWALQMRDRFGITLGLHKRQTVVPGVGAESIALESTAAVARSLERLGVEVVVHAAALTSVEACEADPALAFRVNAEMAGNVARACALCGAKLIHISTDHLFSGEVPLQPETAPVEPLNCYARTKAEGEAQALDACPGALVLRTNFFGWGLSYRQSFSDRILAALRAGQSIGLFTDVFFTPILMARLIEAAHELYEKNQSGVFNLVGDERLSKYDFGVRLAQRVGLDPSPIVRVRFRDRGDLVRRPFDLSLSNRKACSILGRGLGDVDAQIAGLVAEAAAAAGMAAARA
ncbi:MAG: SDR family oxidoreductase [Betaproteobacteria bacterium]